MSPHPEQCDTLIVPPIAAPANPELSARLQAALDNKTKPRGSLGRLEGLALRLGLIQGRLLPALEQPRYWCLPPTTAWPPRGSRPIPVR